VSALQPRPAAAAASGPLLPDAGPGNTRRKLGAWLVFVGAIAAINYTATIADQGKNDANALYQYSTALGETVLYAVMLGIVLWITGSRRDLLALARPGSWWRATGLAAGAFAVSLVIVELALEPFLHGGREQGAVPTHWEPAHATAYAVNWIVLAGVDPLVEELTYRGLGFSLLAARCGKWVSIVGIGLLFAAGHGLFQAFPELAVLGCALAWLRWKTGSVYPGMAVHALFNSVALAGVILATK
jgi:membrane protease YdiL (CAAX protease family)